MTDKSVKKLNTAISHYNTAKKNEAKAEKALATAKSNESKALASINKQKQAIIDQFENPAAPLDAAAQTKLLNQEFALGQKYAQTQSKYATTIAHDKAVITKDKKTVTKDHKAAVKLLKPAEYHLNLKQTNKDRKALGLKSVKHVIRPPNTTATKAAKAVTEAKKYLGKYETQLQREGVTQPCPTSESCANFVTSMLHKTGAINFRTLSVATLNTDLRARGWKVVSLKNAKPGDVWICNGAHGESHTEIVASNKNGKITLIGSNNHPVPSNQQINYDTYSATISGSFILSPP